MATIMEHRNAPAWAHRIELRPSMDGRRQHHGPWLAVKKSRHVTEPQALSHLKMTHAKAQRCQGFPRVSGLSRLLKIAWGASSGGAARSAPWAGLPLYQG